MSIQSKIPVLIKKVPARRWLEYSAAFGRDTQDCMTDAVIAMMVVVNEQHRTKHGSSNLERVLDMNLDELEAVLVAELGDLEEPAEGATFPAAGGDGGAEPGGLDADRLGEGLRADPGADLPGDGDSTAGVGSTDAP